MHQRLHLTRHHIEHIGDLSVGKLIEVAQQDRHLMKLRERRNHVMHVCGLVAPKEYDLGLRQLRGERATVFVGLAQDVHVGLHDRARMWSRHTFRAIRMIHPASCSSSFK